MREWSRDLHPQSDVSILHLIRFFLFFLDSLAYVPMDSIIGSHSPVMRIMVSIRSLLTSVLYPQRTSHRSHIKTDADRNG